jgi:hypothetical protein
MLVFLACQVFRVLEPLYLHFTTGYWGSETFMGGQFANRLSGAPADVINPNGLGFVIVTTIPYLHYLLLPQNLKVKLLYISILPLMLYALILTMSRGAFITLVAGGCVLFYYSRHKFALIIMAVAILAAGWSVMNPAQKARYLSLFNQESPGAKSVEGRMDLILKEFRLGFERPIVGHGLGSTAEAKYHAWGISQASHNLYGQLLIEIGLIGFILFFLYLWQVFKRLRVNQLFLNTLDQTNNFYFFFRLNQAMLIVFWMYAVFSLNYFGLSQYYWYLFGGLTVAFSRRLSAHNHDQDSVQRPA